MRRQSSSLPRKDLNFSWFHDVLLNATPRQVWLKLYYVESFHNDWDEFTRSLWAIKSQAGRYWLYLSSILFILQGWIFDIVYNRHEWLLCSIEYIQTAIKVYNLLPSHLSRARLARLGWTCRGSRRWIQAPKQGLLLIHGRLRREFQRTFFRIWESQRRRFSVTSRARGSSGTFHAFRAMARHLECLWIHRSARRWNQICTK